MGDAAVHHLNGGQRVVSGADQVGVGVTLVGEISPQHQSDFGFDLGLDQPACGNGFAIADGHVGKQHAEVGLVNAELGLDGQRGEADLAADQTPACGQCAFGVVVLDGVGAVCIRVARRSRSGAMGWPLVVAWCSRAAAWGAVRGEWDIGCRPQPLSRKSICRALKVSGSSYCGQ